jgi:fatty acid desaturase
MKETQSIDPQPHQFIDRSDLKGLLALAKDWGAIFLIAIFSYWVNNLFVSLLAIWFIGCFQVAIGESLLHEASHYNLFKTRSWNDRLRFLYALPFFLTLDEYRIQHANHHKYLMTEKDILLEEYERLGFTKTQKKLFFLWFIKPFFVAPIFLLQFIWDDIKLMSSQNKIKLAYFGSEFYLYFIGWNVCLFYYSIGSFLIFLSIVSFFIGLKFRITTTPKQERDRGSIRFIIFSAITRVIIKFTIFVLLFLGITCQKLTRF